MPGRNHAATPEDLDTTTEGGVFHIKTVFEHLEDYKRNVELTTDAWCDLIYRLHLQPLEGGEKVKLSRFSIAKYVTAVVAVVEEEYRVESETVKTWAGTVAADAGLSALSDTMIRAALTNTYFIKPLVRVKRKDGKVRQRRQGEAKPIRTLFPIKGTRMAIQVLPREFRVVPMPATPAE